MATKLDRYREMIKEEHRQARKLVERIGVEPGMTLVKDARRDIEDRIAAIARKGKSERFTHQMLVTTRAQLDEALSQLQTQLKTHARDSLNLLAEHAAENTVDVLHSADDLFTGIVTPLPILEASYLRYVKAKSAGTLLRQYKSSLKRYGSETIESLERIMSQNLLAKAPAMDTMKEIAGEIGLGEAYHWKAERIFRTESASAYGRANAITIREAKLILPDMGKRWVAGPDPCDACADLHDTVVDEDEEFVAVLGKKEVRVMHQPLHPHCIPGKQPINLSGGLGGNRIQATMRRHWEGNLIGLVIGKEEAWLTPDHLVATPDGYKEALLLGRGDEIMCIDPRGKAIQSQKFPSQRAEKLFFGFVLDLFPRKYMPMPRINFNGYSPRRVGQINVEFADSILGGEGNPRCLKERKPCGFIGSHFFQPLSSQGNSALKNKGVFLSPSCLIGRSGNVLSFFRTHPGISQKQSFGACASGNMKFSHDSINRHPFKANYVRYFQDGFPFFPMPSSQVLGIDCLRQGRSQGDIEFSEDSINLALPASNGINDVLHTVFFGDIQVSHLGIINGDNSHKRTYYTHNNVIVKRLSGARKWFWRGPVYDFQTTTGDFNVGGVIVHNCECDVVPWRKVWEGEEDEETA